MNVEQEVKLLKKLNRMKRVVRFLCGTVLALLVLVAFLLWGAEVGGEGKDTVVVEPIVTATPTTSPSYRYSQCPHQNPDTAGKQQFLVVRGVDPATITAVSFQMLDCEGLPIEFWACDLDPRQGSCFPMMPKIPYGSLLYVKIDTPTSGIITQVDPTEVLWEVSFGTTVEEILPASYWQSEVVP